MKIEPNFPKIRITTPNVLEISRFTTNHAKKRWKIRQEAQEVR
jgi:hypothetical protein